MNNLRVWLKYIFLLSAVIACTAIFFVGVVSGLAGAWTDQQAPLGDMGCAGAVISAIILFVIGIYLEGRGGE